MDKLNCEICEQELILRPGADKVNCPQCGHKQPVPEHIYKLLFPRKKRDIELDECQNCAGKMELIPQFGLGICRYCGIKQKLNESYCAALLADIRQKKR